VRAVRLGVVIGLLAATAGARPGFGEPAGDAEKPAATCPLVDGQTQAVIVTGGLFRQTRLAWRYVGDYPPVGAPTAADAQAARLRAEIEKSTGRTLEIVPEDRYTPTAGQPVIYLGATRQAQTLFADRLADIDTDGYVIHVTPSFVVLAGNIDYAVYDFLSTYLGIDHYINTELFTVVPRHERVILPVETRVEVPAFFSRCFNTSRDGKPYRLHAGNGRYAFHHNIGEHFLVEKQFPDHSEFWALVNGVRIPCVGSTTPNPCVLNPDVIDVVAEHCRVAFDKNPQLLSVSLAANDSFRYCQCERCRPLQGKGHSLVVGGKTTGVSDYWYSFMNDVAGRIRQSHPGRFLGTLGYAHADNPPTFPVERNILPYIADSSADWGHAEERDRDMERVRVWIERVDRIGLYEYMYGGAYLVPRLFSRNLADRLRPVAAKCPGSGFYAEFNVGGRGFDGPKEWMAERLLWKPDQDVDALMTRWCTGCFGPAAAPMKGYFDALEAALNRGAARAKPTGILFGYKHEQQFDLYLPEDFPPLWKLLDEARTLAGGDPVILAPIDYFASCLTISEILVRRHHALAEAALLMKNKAAPEEVLASLLRNEKDWPRAEVWRSISELQRTDYLRVGDGPESSRAVQAMEYVLDNGAWPAVARLAAAGSRSAADLRRESQETLEQLVTRADVADPAAAARLAELRAASARIASANRAETPPVIDGRADEACWRWNGQQPWFMRDAATAFAFPTDFAMAYDDRHLYVALRCGGQAVESYDEPLQKLGDAIRAYGCETKRTPSVHIHLDVAVEPGVTQMPAYQVVPNAYGGLWENRAAIASHRATWNADAGEWQAELAIGWEQLGVKPAATRVFRLSVVRYVHSLWNKAVGGWYLSRVVVRNREAQPNERGWLVLE
jgi:hypothetical protein